MKHIFIIGSRGLPVGYSGYETFVLKLTEYSKNLKDIKYHIACRGKGKDNVQYNNAERFYISLPPIGSAKAIIYDVLAFNKALLEIKRKGYDNAWMYILACRIGPFMNILVKKAKKMGVSVAVNPDGHEWLRGKWNKMIKKYWKYSEKLMVKHADLMICDSTEMERYIKVEYSQFHPKTIYLSYGADQNVIFCEDREIENWYKEFGLKEREYYLIVGRFIPENNYELIIREFMKSDSKRSLVLITDVKNNTFYQQLRKNTGFENDNRIKFVGTVFDRPLINRIRKQAYMYFHGHEVGGTNPSLLEAMACECAICAVDVAFSHEVLAENGIYFKKDTGHLSDLINFLEKNLTQDNIKKYGEANAIRVQEMYDWSDIALQYRCLWNESNCLCL